MRLGRTTRTAPPDGPGTGEPGGPPGATGDRRLLGDLLVEQAGVTPAQVAEAMLIRAGTGKRLGSVLVDLGVIDERQLTAALSEQLGLPVADLRERAPEPEAIALLTDSLARSLGAVPLRVVEGGAVEVAVGDAGGTTRQDLERATGRRVHLLLAPPGDVRRVVDSSYRALAGVEEQLAAFAAGSGRSAGAEAPVVQVVDMLVTQAMRDRASDVHIEPQDGQVRVRFRIDGTLHDVVAVPDTMGGALASRIKVMADMNIVERRRPQDGQIATTIDDRPIDIRVSTTGTVFGEKVVLRLLDKSRPLFRLRDLGMPPGTESRFGELIRSPYGMVICAGPTGSGKTTTLYASVSEINGVERNITTIEDPVEYVFPSLNQIQINEQAGVTFAAGLRSILRQDPDVILVGEIRDTETAQIAVQSALTGHFVLSSLHATDSVSALYRFLDMGIEPFLVASSVLAVVGQRLLRRICPHCRVPYVLPPEERAFYQEAGGSGRTHFWIGEGCNLCSQTGYLDRVGVYELLRVTEELRELVVSPNPSHDEMRRVAREQGMRSLRQEAIRLVDQDVTSVAEVVRTIYTL